MRTSLLVLLAILPSAAVPLVKSGRSTNAICTDAGATPAERRAAAELSQFLFEMSGARLPVETACNPAGRGLILVGRSAALKSVAPSLDPDSEGPEGFHIRTIGRHLVIAGGRPRGTLYGVYTILDRLGCRWYTSEVSRIPKRRDIETGVLDLRQRPAFEYREPFVTEAWDRDWAARNRTNGNSARLDESTGGKVSYYPFVHSFYELLPPDKYFASHPEYYSLIDGKRRVERGQLCLTNPDVLRLGVERVEEWIAAHPEAQIFSVSQNDWEGWCECDRCRRVEEEEGGVHSGPILRFVNALAEQVGRKHPEKLIDTLAYWYTEDPPAKVRPVKNVRIRLCPIGVCGAHPYESCPRSAYFVRNLKAWHAITNQLYIWHYNTNFSHYLAPFPDFDELAANIPLYHRSGVVGIFLEGSYPQGGGGELAELRSWVMARQLWDPSTNVDAAVTEFLEGVYGKAAGSLRAYYDLLHRQVRPAPRGAGEHIWIFVFPEFQPDFSRQARALLDKALAAAGDEATRARVRKATLPLDYFDVVRAREHRFENGSYAPAALDDLKRRWSSFLDTLAGFGVQSIHEGQPLERDRKAVEGLKAWPTVAMENAAWRVDVVPELRGRVPRMIDKQSGRNLLRTPNPGENGYPDLGGLSLEALPDYVSRAWPAQWRLESSGPNSAVAVGTCANGVLLRRRMALEGEGLRIDSEAVNQGTAAVELVLAARAEYDAGDIDTAEVSFRSKGGAAVTKRLLDPMREPAATVTWRDQEAPAGEWVVSAGGRRLASSRFDAAQTARASVAWSAKGRPRVTLGNWSQAARLQPGDTLRLAVEYGR